MLIPERQQRLLAMLRDRGGAGLDELAEALDVSASTVRRDLEALEARGSVERTHGGALYKGSRISASGRGRALTERMGEYVSQKRAIAAMTASIVEPHMTLLMDGGSTVVLAAQAIEARPLQVVTNSLAIARHFVDDEAVEVVLVGGNVYPRTGVTVGPFATGSLSELHADLLLFSLAGVWGGEAYNINLEMAQVEQVMMRQAAASLLLMDSSKFGRKSLVRVCSVDAVDRVITDAGIDETWRARLGERLLVAEAGETE